MVKESKIELDFASIELLPSGICRLVFYDGIELKESDVKILHQQFIQLFKGVPRPIMIVTGRNSLATQGARDYSAKQMNEIRLAEAYVCETVYHRILVNLYYTLSRPKKPLKVFDNETDAENWLLSFL